MSKDLSTVSTVLESLVAERTAAPAGPILDVKRLFTLRLPLIIAVAVILAIPAAVGSWFLVPAEYTASADIRFLATMPRVMESEGKRDASTPYDKFLNTQISLIMGNTILSRVLDRPGIRALGPLAKASDPLEFLKNHVAVRVQRNSELATVSCSMEQQDVAQRILEGVVAEYMEYAMGAEASAGGERLGILTKERDARQMELEAQLRQMAELQSSIGMPLTNDKTVEGREGDLYRESMVKAEEEVSKTNAQRSDLESQLKQIQALQAQSKAAPDKPIFDYGIEDKVNLDPRMSGVRQDVVRMEANSARLAEQLKEGAPTRKEEEKKLASAKASEAQLQRSVRASVLDSLRAQCEQQLTQQTKAAEEAGLRAEKFKQLLTQYDEKVSKATDRLAELEELKRKTDETRAQLEGVRREITQINIESKAPARVQLAAPATVPAGGPNPSRRFMAMGLAIVLSLGVGAGAGLLRELTDQQIRSADDVKRVTRVPVIAMLHEASEDPALKGTEYPLLYADRPTSTTAEEFRRILARVLYPEDCSVEVKSLVIASPTQGDGKTSLACNLSLAMADAGRRVLLIDLSSRRPSIESCFKLEPAEGLSDLLRGDCGPDQAIRATQFENLWVLGPGVEADELASKLASREMVKFMEWAEDEFDHLVMDTPPALLMSDARMIAPLMDGVLVVVGSMNSTLGMVRRCLHEMEQVGANVVGVALNKLHGTRGGYFRQNLELYQAYAAEGGNGKVKTDIADIQVVEDEPAIVLLPYENAEDPRQPAAQAHRES